MKTILSYLDFDKFSNVLNDFNAYFYPELCAVYNQNFNPFQKNYFLNATINKSCISVISKPSNQKEIEMQKISEFLDLFKLEDAIVSINNLEYQYEIMNLMLERKLQFLIKVQKNQYNLYQAIANECSKLSIEFDTLPSCTFSSKNNEDVQTYKLTFLNNFIFDEFKNESNNELTIGILDKITPQKEMSTFIITNIKEATLENLLLIIKAIDNNNMDLFSIYFKETKNTTNSAQVFRKFVSAIKKRNKEFEKWTNPCFSISCCANPDFTTEILFTVFK